MSILGRLCSLGSVLPLAFGLLACADVDVRRVPGVQASAAPGADGGQTPQALPPQCVPLTTTKSLRILFMVDNSGSTLETDPAKKYRVASIQQFLEQVAEKPNFTYSLGMFGGSSAYLWNMSGTPSRAAAGTAPGALFGSAALMTSALSDFNTRYASSGGTPYTDAFTLLKKAVRVDTEAHGNQYKYIVLFISDGRPSPRLASSDATELTVAQARVGDLSELATAAGSELTVSTVYFGPAADSGSSDAPHAIALMRAMAEAGHGQFVDTNALAGNTYNVADVITIPCPGQL